LIMTAILPVIYKLSIQFTICKKHRRLVARRFERLVQAVGAVGEGLKVTNFPVSKFTTKRIIKSLLAGALSLIET